MPTESRKSRKIGIHKIGIIKKGKKNGFVQKDILAITENTISYIIT